MAESDAHDSWGGQQPAAGRGDVAVTRELRDFIRVYDGALSAGQCGELLAAFEQLQEYQERNGAGIRPALEASAWSELDLGAHGGIGIKALFLEQVQRYHQIYNADLGMSLPISPVRRLAQLIMKRYRVGSDERFQLHFDALGEVANRYLVFLWYLNDVEEGGETQFPDIGVSVAPRTGRLVVFPPYWMFQHAGLPPRSGDKYILSTYLLY